MAPRKKKQDTAKETPNLAELHTTIMGSGLTVDQAVSDTLKINYMPYAMSVIVSRAIPEIDGFKPSHRKLLYTMYGMGLLNGGTIKSANIVGRTMQLNPHGDAAIYETMVRLTTGNEALLHPYVKSKGSFGKAYSRDMKAAASRYTEAKLNDIAAELFRDINKDTVDFVDNYDATMKEPTLLPVTFPSILVNNNSGIAVAMASEICSFNLKEVCDTTIALMRDPDHPVADTMPAPDFPSGGQLLYNREEMDKIYETGRGSFKVRCVYSYDSKNNCIDITQIPPSTTCEAIIEKVVDLVKLKKVTEVNDIRDETGLQGLRITIDLKRGTDPEKLMKKLFKMTPLEDSYPCNFNLLIAGSPRVLGIKEIINEWTAFRMECVRRRVYFDLQKAKDKLHLLKGLSKILLDIDKAIKIVRDTKVEAEVVPNLMIGFGIDEIQANYVAEIKLRHLNREYILNRLEELEELEKKVQELEDTLKSGAKIKNIIIGELKEVAKKYGQDRKTAIIYTEDVKDEPYVEEVPDYPVHLFYTKEGYFKKILPNSLRMSGDQKLKEGDEISQTFDTTNNMELLFFTNQCQVYKSAVSAFDETKASNMGDYVAGKLGMDEGEVPIYMALTDKDYLGNMLFFFENGKVAKVEMSAYKTLTNRKKLLNAYSDKAPVVAIHYAPQEREYLMTSSNGRMLLFHSAAILAKTTKNTQGVAVMTQKRGHRLLKVEPYADGMLMKPHRYRTRTLPSAGSYMQAEEQGEQLML